MAQEGSKSPLKIDDLEGTTLTAGEAFLAMGKYIADFASRVRPDRALVTLWSGVEIENDGSSGDPAALEDWLKAVQKVLGERKSDQRDSNDA